MDHECEIECLLLSVVVCNQCNRFHVLYKITKEHVIDKAPTMGVPGGQNGILSSCVEHETRLDNLGLYEYLLVKFLIKNGIEKSDLLRSIKSSKVVLGFQDEWQGLELVLDMHEKAHLLCL